MNMNCLFIYAALTATGHIRIICYMSWCPFNTPASAVGVGGGGFHGIRSVGGGAQPLGSNRRFWKLDSLRVCSTGSHTATQPAMRRLAMIYACLFIHACQ
jgi:hypothetical protein